MSGNPNMQKMGKRKMASAQQQPDWLFPATAKSQKGGRSNDTLEKKPANDLSKRRAAAEPAKQSPPPELINLVGAFLNENEFTHASRSFATDRKTRGEGAGNLTDLPSLNTIYSEWRKWKEEKASATGKAVKQQTPLKSNNKDDSSSSESSSDEDEDSDVEMADAEPAKKHIQRKSSPSASSSSSSDSDADDENETPVVKVASPKTKVSALKRKEHPGSDSSASDSDSSSDSSSEDEAPKSKKAKTAASTSSDDSSSSSDSDSDSSSENEAPKAKKSNSASNSSSSESSESDSDSDSSTNSIAQKVPLPESASESDSDSTSESESDSDHNDAAKKPSSDTSATLSDEAKHVVSSSADSSSASDSDVEASTKVTTKSEQATARKLSPPLPPNPVPKLPRKTNQPFSRIPKDIKVDERLASNAYVPYDYAERAHQDLIVTKGKGFTKEKNKKKRGSYRGGYIDVEGKKGIKFDD